MEIYSSRIVRRGSPHDLRREVEGLLLQPWRSSFQTKFPRVLFQKEGDFYDVSLFWHFRKLWALSVHANLICSCSIAAVAALNYIHVLAGSGTRTHTSSLSILTE